MNRPKYFDSGSQFYNEKKKDSHPDMKGLVDIGGILFWMSSWWKKTKDGDDFLSHSFTAVSDEEMDKYFKGQAAPESRPESGAKKQNSRAGGPRRERTQSGVIDNESGFADDGKGNSSFDDEYMDGPDDDMPF